jgi:predicted RNA-binding Zn ribbon-like protein
MLETDIYSGNLNLNEARLCLDFGNTANWHASTHPQEELNSYDDVLNWAQQKALLPVAQISVLRAAAAQNPAAAQAALERAIALREAIYRIFSAAAVGRPVADADLALLNRWLAEGLGRLQLASTEEGFAWQWQADNTALHQMLWPAAQSAAELLASAELDRVKECADDRGCGWLFLDTSRNGTRRWCSMQSCGNRAKVRRHRRQQTTEEG